MSHELIIGHASFLIGRGSGNLSSTRNERAWTGITRSLIMLMGVQMIVMTRVSGHGATRRHAWLCWGGGVGPTCNHRVKVVWAHVSPCWFTWGEGQVFLPRFLQFRTAIPTWTPLSLVPPLSLSPKLPLLFACFYFYSLPFGKYRSLLARLKLTRLQVS